MDLFKRFVCLIDTLYRLDHVMAQGNHELLRKSLAFLSFGRVFYEIVFNL